MLLTTDFARRVYVIGLAHAGALTEVMTEANNIAGAVAGIFVILLFVTAIGFVRRRQYELFYAMHLVLVAGILIAGMRSKSFKPSKTPGIG